MINLKVITLTGVFVDKEVHEVAVPTTAGTIAINGGHAPLLGAVHPGVLSIQYNKSDKESDRQQVAVYEGTVEVLDNTVSVLVDDVDTPDEISEAEAEKALARAKELKEKAGSAVDLAEAQAMMDRSAVRLQLAGLKKRSKRQ